MLFHLHDNLSHKCFLVLLQGIDVFYSLCKPLYWFYYKELVYFTHCVCLLIGLITGDMCVFYSLCKPSYWSYYKKLVNFTHCVSLHYIRTSMDKFFMKCCDKMRIFQDNLRGKRTRFQVASSFKFYEIPLCTDNVFSILKTL